MDNKIEVRKAFLEDLEDLAKIQIESWRKAFKEILTPNILETRMYGEKG